MQEYFIATMYFLAAEITLGCGFSILERKLNRPLNSVEEQNRLLKQSAMWRELVIKYGRTINRQGKRIHNLKRKLAAVTEDRDRWQQMHENALKEARLAEAALADRYRA